MFKVSVVGAVAGEREVKGKVVFEVDGVGASEAEISVEGEYKVEVEVEVETESTGKVSGEVSGEVVINGAEFGVKNDVAEFVKFGVASEDDGYNMCVNCSYSDSFIAKFHRVSLLTYPLQKRL